MKTKIRYAKVVVPDRKHLRIDRNGHQDTFIYESMSKDGIIEVKHRPERGWYWDADGWTYHCSWLKFVKKPTKVTK